MKSSNSQRNGLENGTHTHTHTHTRARARGSNRGRRAAVGVEPESRSTRLASWANRSALACAILATGLGGCSDEAPGYASDEPSTLSEAVFAQSELKLVVQDYPFIGDRGQLVCQEWEKELGNEQTQRYSEFYHVNRMNRQLEHSARGAVPAEVKDAVSDFELAIHIEELKYIRDNGLSSVETCDEAREFVRLKNEYAELDAPEFEDVEDDVEPGVVTPRPSPGTVDPGERVDKIFEGQFFGNTRVVIVVNWSNNGNSCTGVLIGPDALVTSAHCFAGSGGHRLAVGWNDSATFPCLAGSSTCQDPGSNNATVTVHPNYTGGLQGQNGTDVGDDVAVVQLTGGATWPAPFNTASAWHAIVTNTQLVNRPYYWANGYGRSGPTASPDFLQRLTTLDLRGNWMGSKHFYDYAVSGRGRGCIGDSGGGGINTQPHKEVLIGLYSNFDGTGNCPTAGAKMRYTLLGPKSGWIVSLVGPCSLEASSGPPGNGGITTLMECF